MLSYICSNLKYILYMFKFKVFLFHTWDSFCVLICFFFLVVVSLNLFRGLSCIKNEALALFSLSLIYCIYKAFSDEPDVVRKQAPPARRAGESLSTVHENSFCCTGVTRWFMKCQTLLPLKNSGLHICLSCLFQLSWWHTVPVSPGMVLWTLWQMNGGSFPPF